MVGGLERHHLLLAAEHAAHLDDDLGEGEGEGEGEGMPPTSRTTWAQVEDKVRVRAMASCWPCMPPISRRTWPSMLPRCRLRVRVRVRVRAR